MTCQSSPSSSRSSSPALALDPATLAILNSFLTEKAEEEERFKSLAEREGGEEVMLSVDDFRSTFGENFGVSQFWSVPSRSL